MADEASPTTEKKNRGLNLSAQCRDYHLPFWQCPEVLMIFMGVVTIIAISSFYFIGVLKGFDPQAIALIAVLLTAFFLVLIYIIMQAFEKIAEAN